MFAKMFSFKGTLNRKEYLIYGIIAPILIVFLAGVIAAFFKDHKDVQALLLMIALLANIYISIAAVVKRARETATSVGLIIFLWIVLTPIIVLYLLFAPAKRGENEKMSAWSIVLSIIISIVIVLALLFVIALPKLAKTREAALQAKQEQLLKSTHQESNLTNEN